MGAYDYIQDPVPGQPISSSLFGARVKASIQDLDRRLSAYDASTGIGKAAGTSNIVIATTTETAVLTITGQVFRAGYAYQCTMRSGFQTGAVGTLCLFRLRKTTIGGTDYGEYFRFEGKGTPVMGALGSLYLVNTGATDIVNDVLLTATSNVAAASALTVYGSAASPRFLTIVPAGFAVDYVGMGPAVSA
jgi:hypothetical protein